MSSANLGAVRGVVSADSTGNFLEGAVVAVEGTSKAANTDRRGEFSLSGLPAGSHRLSVTYTGMKPAVHEIKIVAGQVASVTVDLKSDAVMMGAFSVLADRSADSIALTQQRNALNVKNVVDTASYGVLANGNPAELLQLLPGISGQLFGSEVDRVSIRGIASNLNTVSLDGNQMSRPDINVGSGDRSFVLYTTNTASIKTVEVTKALTPDISADSVGGRVNLIQKSALDYSASAMRFDYTAGVQYVERASGFNAPFEPNLKFAYHTALGDDRNWGIYASAGYIGEHINNYYWISSVNAPAGFGGAPYPNLFIEAEAQNIRKRSNAAATLDFRPNKNFESTFRFKYDSWFEEGDTVFSQKSFSSPRAGSPEGVFRYDAGTIQTISAPNPADVKSASFAWDAKYLVNGWTITGGLFDSGSVTRIDARNDKYGTIIALFNPGTTAYAYEIDRRGNPNLPKFSVIGGNPTAIYNLSNYTLPTFQQVNFYTDDTSRSAKLTLEKTFDTSRVTYTLKAGGEVRSAERTRQQENNTRSYVGADGVAGLNVATGINDDNLSMFLLLNPNLPGTTPNGNRRLPMLDHLAVARSYRTEPGLWTENAYNNIVNSMNNNWTVSEDISSAYLMGIMKWSRLSVLSGVRFERTEVKSNSVLQNPVQATAAQIPDPLARAKNNLGGRVSKDKSYSDLFPSLHATYQVFPNAQVRASYATGIGRPAMTSIISTTTVNLTTRTVNTGRADLKPQHADNFDLAFEYYTQPAGVISVGAFRKKFNNFIVSTTSVVQPGSGLGQDDEYVGYTLVTPSNEGQAEVNGLEFNYVQQLNFVPRKLGLVTFRGNLTRLDSKGNYGVRTAGVTTPTIASYRGLARFTPLAWNLVLDYKKGPFAGMVRYNRQGRTLNSRGADERFDQYFPERYKIDLNASYAMRRNTRLICTIDNLTAQKSLIQFGRNEPIYFSQSWDSRPRFTFGVEGSF